MRSIIINVANAICLLFMVNATSAQQAVQTDNYPTRPVRAILGLPPGGGIDLIARTVLTNLSEGFGVPFILDNRAGAGGIIATELVAKSRPDGYTLLVSSAPFTIAPFLYTSSIHYDVRKDFAPITLIATQRLLLVVNASVKANTLPELIALAKARPGELNIGIADPGGGATLAAELFKIVTNTKMVSIPYNGAAPALIALMSNDVQLNFTTPAVAVPQLKSGKIKALAATGNERASYLPDIPTLTELGIKDFNVGPSTGLVAPAKTPSSIIDKLYRQVAAGLKLPSTRERLVAAGVDIVGSSPKEYATFINNQLETNSKIIKAAGLKID